MKTRSSRTMVSRRTPKLALEVSLFAVFVAGFLVSSIVRFSAAQQELNRQLTATGPAGPGTAKRTALVIGNGAYSKAPPLKNPANDARDMGATLKSLGFDVTSGINIGQREMKRLIREFGQKLKGGGAGLFYFAGHGVQSKGRNYLIPVDAEIESEAEVEDSGVDLSFVLNVMDEAANGLNLVILDACRNNPFARSFRSTTEGLAQVDAATGTLIAYATAPGRVAADGPGQNGLYTSELLKTIQIPGASAVDVFMRVRAEVMRQTDNKQIPWEVSSLVGSFYFSPPTGASNINSPRPDTAPPLSNRVDPEAFELSYWETIKNSTDPEDFKSYLEKYPNGQFAAIAQKRARAANGPFPGGNPSDTNVDDVVTLLTTLGVARLDLGQFGEELESVKIIERCRIKVESRTLWTSKARFKPTILETIVSLGDINVASIAPIEITPPDRPRLWVVTARTFTGRTFTQSITGYENRSLEKIKIPTKTQNPNNSYVGAFGDADSANRYARAFANAARSCGAKSETF